MPVLCAAYPDVVLRSKRYIYLAQVILPWPNLLSSCSLTAIMATAKSPKGNNRVEYHYWDYHFRWTDLHRSSEELRLLTRSFDTLADECVKIINDMPPHPSNGNKNPFKRDIYAALSANADKDPKLRELWTEINTVPEWVDWEQIKRGQDVYYRYAIPIITAVSAAYPTVTQ